MVGEKEFAKNQDRNQFHFTVLDSVSTCSVLFGACGRNVDNLTVRSVYRSSNEEPLT